MALHPTQTRRERILCYGPPNSGKSRTWRGIADWIFSTGADSHIYVIDTDYAWESQCPPADDDHLAKIVTQRDVRSWDDFDQATDAYLPSAIKRATKGRSDDWLVVDMIDRMWSVSQNDFFIKAYDSDIDDYMIAARRSGQNLGGEYGVNWSVINAMYGSLNDKLKAWPGHILACTSASELHYPDPRSGRGGDPEAMIALFGKTGFKPQGQKALPYEFSTVMFHQQRPDGSWVVSTVKERSSPEQPREWLTGAKVEPDFVTVYLLQVAKWRP